jgi:hypothetical protein
MESPSPGEMTDGSVPIANDRRLSAKTEAPFESSSHESCSVQTGQCIWEAPWLDLPVGASRCIAGSDPREEERIGKAFR